MKIRSRKSFAVIVGAALIAAPVISAAEKSTGQINSYELLQQIRNLQREVAELRDRIDQQEYAMRQNQSVQQDNQRRQPVLPQPSTAYPAQPAQPNAQQSLPVQPLPPAGSEGTVAQQAVNQTVAPVVTNTGPVIEERDLSAALPLESAAPATTPSVNQPNSDAVNTENALRVEDRVIEPSQPAPVRQARPSSSVANPQAELLRQGDKAIQTTLQEEDLYAKGLDQLKRQQYEQAVSVFNSQLQAYPRGQRSADAYYWIGESLYILENLESSKKSYQSILTLFPSSRRVPNALFKVAKIEHEQGNDMAAKATLQSLLARYPKSAAAAQAKATLSKLL